MIVYLFILTSSWLWTLTSAHSDPGIFPLKQKETTTERKLFYGPNDSKKTIEFFLQNGIHGEQDLADALKTALEFEYWTIPIYLVAGWSMKPGLISIDIDRIVDQEMAHFAIVGNILNSLGIPFNVGVPSFLPAYNTSVTPSGLTLTSPLQPDICTMDQVKLFSEIEYPEFAAPVGGNTPPKPKGRTVGEFYKDMIIPNLPTDPSKWGLKKGAFKYEFVIPITSIEDAIAQIDIIMHQGEGTNDTDPVYHDAKGDQLAHYYAFNQIHVGKRLVKDAKTGVWSYTGATIPPPTLICPELIAGDQGEFQNSFTSLMIGLQKVWNGTDAAVPSEEDMYVLEGLGNSLLAKCIRPSFLFS